MRRAEDINPYLGRGEAHWRNGYSAKSLATAWFSADDIPPPVRRILVTRSVFVGAELVDANLERSVDLREGYRASQTDLLATIAFRNRLAVAAVEGKVEESFGPLVGNWLNDSPSRADRLERLYQCLGLDRQRAGPLRYQLLHRTASAIYEAERYRSRTALVIVHSFSGAQTGVKDYASFLSALGLHDGAANRICGPILCNEIEVYFGWVADALPAE